MLYRAWTEYRTMVHENSAKYRGAGSPYDRVETLENMKNSLSSMAQKYISRGFLH